MITDMLKMENVKMVYTIDRGLMATPPSRPVAKRPVVITVTVPRAAQPAKRKVADASFRPAPAPPVAKKSMKSAFDMRAFGLAQIARNERFAKMIKAAAARQWGRAR
jgi:hypothetical protein